MTIEERDRAGDRRQFLKFAAANGVFAGSWVLAQGAPDEDGPGSAAFPDSPEQDAERVFPQGIASGDPRPDGFLLWTRVPGDDSAKVGYQVSDSARFDTIVRAGAVVASAESDFTVRVRVEGLDPHRRYWYRFRAKHTSSPIGRAKTAPLADQRVPVTMAFASCQDYVGRWYHAWRVLAERADEIDFVLFLGDYIYEYERYPDLQEPQPGRAIELPDGLVIDAEKGIIAARTLADYRAIYRAVNADRDLRRIRALCPFVIIWDDHEHANDAWRDHAADFNERKGDERDPQRRMAASRAWYEHLPVDIPFAPEKGFPDDIVTWRTVRWGQHLELVLTDERYYRDDHLVPEGPLDPKVGKILPYSPLGSRTMCIKSVFDEREAKKRPTMLGANQRDWLVRTLKESAATWKVWASALQVASFVLDLRDQELPAFRHVFYFKTDQWDGYPSERALILQQLAELENFVVFSGDLHGFYAAELRQNFDDARSKTVGVEFTVAGISSISLAEQIEAIAAAERSLRIRSTTKLAARLDEVLIHSAPYFVHANSRGYGAGIARFDDRTLAVEFIAVDGVREAAWRGVPQSTCFLVRAGEARIEKLGC